MCRSIFVRRVLLAVLVGASVLVGSVNTASAKPPDPDACTFELGFAAIREVLGEEIVGECASNQTFDRFGNATQETTDGTLFWLARRNQGSFHDGSQLWVNGPRGEGLRSRLTVGGLGERERRNDPVTAPVADVFEYAALTPGDIGDAWSYGVVPRTVPAELDLACYPNRTDPSFGSTYVWFLNEEAGSSFVQTLTALPSDESALLRTRLETEVAACNGWTERSRLGTVRITYRVEPFLALGDDSAVVEFGIENVDTGERRVGRSAYVRYGGLMSTLSLLAPSDLSPDAVAAELERLAGLADASVWTAAWYLRD